MPRIYGHDAGSTGSANARGLQVPTNPPPVRPNLAPMLKETRSPFPRLSPEQAQKILTAPRRGRGAPLTQERRKEILDLYLSGLSMQAVAGAAHASVSTVSAVVHDAGASRGRKRTP